MARVTPQQLHKRKSLPNREQLQDLRANQPSSLKRQHPHPIQTVANPIRALQNLPTTISSETEALKLLTMTLPIFDTAFFFSSLSTKLPAPQVYVRDSTNPRTKDRGYFSHSEHTIRIRYPLCVTRGTQAQQYLSTLLHELIPVFLHIYSCERSLTCSISHEEAWGRISHGTAWCSYANAIQRVLERDLAWEVDLNIRGVWSMRLGKGES
jgi:hypothetical protein